MSATKMEFTSSAVRMLKGAPLSCLILLVIERQPVSAQYLERNTGYSDKLVHSALLLLEEKELITRNGRYAWQIAAGVRQLPLMQALMEPEDGTADEKDFSDYAEEGSCGEVEGCQRIIKTDETDCGSRGDAEPAEEKTVIEALENPVDKPVENSTGSRRNSESEKFRVPSTSSRSLTTRLTSNNLPPPELGDGESEKFRVGENLRACIEAGIEEPKRSELARLPHVTARMIRYHKATAPNIKLAIYRIGKGWKVPEGWEDGAGEDDDRRRYISGEFAEFIEY